MMDLSELFRVMNEREIYITLSTTTLYINAPSGRLTPDVREALAHHKATILSLRPTDKTPKTDETPLGDTVQKPYGHNPETDETDTTDETSIAEADAIRWVESLDEHSGQYALTCELAGWDAMLDAERCERLERLGLPTDREQWDTWHFLYGDDAEQIVLERYSREWDWWDHVADDDLSYLAESHNPTPCVWCGGRIRHSRTCDELQDSWSMPLPFGKHKGQTVRAVAESHPDYLQWLLSKCTLTADLSSEIRRCLNIDEPQEASTDAP